jgi:hypothetical protein
MRQKQRLLPYTALTERTLLLRLSYVYCEVGSQFLSKCHVKLVLQRHYVLYKVYVAIHPCNSLTDLTLCVRYSGFAEGVHWGQL